MTGKNEIAGLVQEHEAIRAQLRFLADSLNSLALKCSHAATSSSHFEALISNCRLELYDFRDGIENHIELDERIFQYFGDRTQVEDLKREHHECRDRIADAIRLAESADKPQASPEVLAELTSTIKAAVEKASQSIIKHMDRENLLFKRMGSHDNS